jgi:hypothetical protein
MNDQVAGGIIFALGIAGMVASVMFAARVAVRMNRNKPRRFLTFLVTSSITLVTLALITAATGYVANYLDQSELVPDVFTGEKWILPACSYMVIQGVLLALGSLIPLFRLENSAGPPHGGTRPRK